MFVSVKNLIVMIDKDIQFLNEAYDSRGNHSEKVFEAYVEMMTDKLDARFEKLCQISSNKQLIEKYKQKIEEVKKVLES